MDQVGTADGRNKKLTGDGSTEEFSTVMIYNLGLTIGLTVSDIDNMTSGEIIDLAYYKANKAEDQQERKDSGRQATQADYDSF